MASSLQGHGIICLLFITRVFLGDTYQKLLPCTNSNISNITLNCDLGSQTRKVVYYWNSHFCNWNKNVTIPKPIHVPCYCDPGLGKDHSYSKECKKCEKGYFSHGGEFIDDWSKWNTTSGLTGHEYGADSYCSDFLTGEQCISWHPSGDYSFLISSNFKNSTLPSCFEQSILVMTRKFVRKPPNNKITFEYKVDGVGCRRGIKTCSNGLFVYLNGKLETSKDVQFTWLKYEIKNLKQGINKVKFVYHKSCTREKVLDVAYIRHLAFVGTDNAESPCHKCKPGTYSDKVGAKYCEKCKPNTYQDKEGETSCKQCDRKTFSRLGATKCLQLPKCRKSDFYVRPDDISTCFKKSDGNFYRKQQVKLPKWPGYKNKSCDDEDFANKPNATDLQCFCSPGYQLDTKDEKVVGCKRCSNSFYADGTMTQCKKCGEGEAAVPGFFVDVFDGERINSLFKQNCSGSPFCPEEDQIWLPRGSYMATSRIPGNHEMTLEFREIEIDYHEAKVSFNCSVDCRMDNNGTRLAKHDHCFMRFVLQRFNKTSGLYQSVHEADCVNKYRHYLRNGTVQQHHYPIKDSGNYSFVVIFHQEDEANFSMISYEGRIHFADIYGAKHGTARQCTKCKAGTRLSDDKRFCVKCPNGTYSEEGSNMCKPCVNNTFADKVGTQSCTPCGSGTKANAQKDGCDYNGCTFSPKDGVKYDLSPLKREGGSMYQVRTYQAKSKYYFPLLYYINICTLDHDNTSCYNIPRERLKGGYPQAILIRTMACKRWSFDALNSYSIGEVLSFKPWKGNLTNGLILELHRGSKCWNKETKAYQNPVTHIRMECDMTAGTGYPEALNNNTGVDARNCRFEIRWRSKYACRVCNENDFVLTESKCVNGNQTVTKVWKNDCRIKNNSPRISHYQRICYLKYKNSNKENIEKDSPTSLIVAIVISVLVIICLLVIVAYYAKRNRFLRSRLFSPGKSFSKVQIEDDQDELVDNMIN